MESMANSMARPGEESGGKVAEINVTPMIDILLVLLIIFMVIVPVTPNGLSALLAKPAKPDAQPAPDNAVVLQVAGHPGALTYRINDAVIAHAAILARLTEIYASRAQRVLFVEGGDQVRFADVAELLDMGRAAGAVRIGLITPGSRSIE
jgi:biopolymer transport protein TolR